MRERLFLAGRLGMHVQDDGVDMVAEPARVQFPLQRGKGIVERIHEDAAHDLHHQHLGAVAGRLHGGAAAGRAGGKIGRADKPVLTFDEHQRLALVPGVVAERDDIRAGIEQFMEDVFRQPEATGGVFGIDGDKIDGMGVDQAGKTVKDDIPARSADQITNEQTTHEGSRGSGG